MTKHEALRNWTEAEKNLTRNPCRESRDACEAARRAFHAAERREGIQPEYYSDTPDEYAIQLTHQALSDKY